MNQLRQTLRQQRRALTEKERHQYAQQVCEHIEQSNIYQQSKSLAGYIAQDGEQDLNTLWLTCTKEIYLPIVYTRPNRLKFARYRANEALTKNKFGILEPIFKISIVAQQLDCLLLPLVAFDTRGNRIGMGGGFYDYSLRKRAKKPFKMGVAYQFQCVDNIQTEDWDIPLDAIATEKGIIYIE